MRISIKAEQLRINPNVFSQPILRQFCVQQLFDVQRRLRKEIARGRNAHGGPIKGIGYSKKYRQEIMDAKRGFQARKKAAQLKGSKRLAKQGSRYENKLAQKDPNVVNLFVTGDMLNSMQVKPEQPVAARMFLGSGEQTEKAAELHMMGFTGWFEYGETDLRNIDKATGPFLADALKKLVEVKKG